MAQTQIAFDFDASVAVPATEKNTVPATEKNAVPAIEKNAVPTTEKITATVAGTLATVAGTATVDNKNVPKPKDTRGRKSLAAAASGAALVQVPPDEELFAKLYYSVGQVSAMFNITPSLLRLWENEFTVLQPRKNGKGDRLFRPEDIKMLQLIYHLLRERKYTMQGAKEYLRANARVAEKSSLIAELKQLKSFLQELKASL